MSPAHPECRGLIQGRVSGSRGWRNPVHDSAAPPHSDNLSILIPTMFPALISKELSLWLAQVDAQLLVLCHQ